MTQKYTKHLDLTGEYEDRNLAFTRGDSRIAMTIGRNSDTEKLGREFRFIIDDPQSPQKLAYVLSKPLKVGNFYNDTGVYKFVLQESVTTKDDNLELGIADYYKHFPVKVPDYSITTDIDPEHNLTDDGRQVYL